MTHRGSNDAQEGIAVARGLTVKGRVATSLGLAAACVAVSIVVNEAMFDTAFSVPLRRRGVVADAPR